MSLKIKNLTKSFGKKVIFSDFSYDFGDKGVYVLRGESGIGKTTLLRMIAGLDKNFSGEIVGGGIGNVSFAFQEYRLFPELSALDNVMIASVDNSDADRLEAVSLLSKLGFSTEDTSLFPSELSGGMKQRVSLARALLKKAPVLLLDEPTKELDPALCERVCEMIRKCAEERTVLLVTHTDSDAELLRGEQIDL